nr:DUF4157 domain-containing protein [Streptomyces flavochromogenes]
MLQLSGHPHARPSVQRKDQAQEQHVHGASCGHQQTASGRPAVQRSTVHDVLAGTGRPMDAPLREEMEARIGADFSDVRIHDNGAARASAAEIGARAYTSGNNVVIGDGGGDKHTLAHELTHVVQQRQGPVSGTSNGAGLSISDPGDRFEREAEANAARVMAGEPSAVRSAGDTPHHSASAIQRAGGKGPKKAAVKAPAVAVASTVKTIKFPEQAPQTISETYDSREASLGVHKVGDHVYKIFGGGSLVKAPSGYTKAVKALNEFKKQGLGDRIAGAEAAGRLTFSEGGQDKVGWAVRMDFVTGTRWQIGKPGGDTIFNNEIRGLALPQLEEIKENLIKARKAKVNDLQGVINSGVMHFLDLHTGGSGSQAEFAMEFVDARIGELSR